MFYGKITPTINALNEMADVVLIPRNQKQQNKGLQIFYQSLLKTLTEIVRQPEL